MWLIAGLGNPGPKYQNNRHNIGFMVVDELAKRAGATSFRQKFGGEVASCQLGAQSVLLLKPMEFMNLSGYAVQRASAFHKVEPKSIIVVHDEIDLDFGRLRLKSGGGHGGHNGLRSIIEQLGSKDFLRTRVGVGKPGKGVTAAGGPSKAAGGDRRVAGWVLSDFPKAQDSEVEELIERSADATTAIIESGIRAAMNKFNSDPKKHNKKNDKSSVKEAETAGQAEGADPA
jgi:PTH1 family peptidyl-tRNA hydrolase